jgi:protein involved in polysaccharide export with SLBB domain
MRLRASQFHSAKATRPKSKRPAYRLDAGDVVAVIVFGITGEYSKAPVHMPSGSDGTLPAVGNPMVVMNDGTLPMPLLDPVVVRGLTITQARDKLSREYVKQDILKKDRQVTLSLMRKRTVNVSVLHDDPVTGSMGISNVKIPADQPRVLEAVIASGPYDRDADIRVIRSNGRYGSSRSKLKTGDVVHVRSSPAGRFFTGGDLKGGQYALPSGRIVNALQAMSIAGGLGSNASVIGPTQVVIVRQGGESIQTRYADLLRNPNAYPIRPGDTLIVR